MNCRKKGLQVSTVDSLIAAICIQHDCELFTNDKDFRCISEYSDLQLFSL